MTKVVSPRLVVDREAGQGYGVTLFDSADSLSGSREAAAKLREQTSAQASGLIGEFVEYDVVARAEAPSGVAAG